MSILIRRTRGESFDQTTECVSHPIDDTQNAVLKP